MKKSIAVFLAMALAAMAGMAENATVEGASNGATASAATNAAVGAAAEAGDGAAKAYKRKKRTPEEVAAEREETMRETGGYMDWIPAGPMVIVADARTEANAAVPARVAEVVRNMFKIAATNEVLNIDEGAAIRKEANALRKQRRALMAIVVYNGGKEEPSLAIYPEERVAIVNADAATAFAGGADAEVRIIKECWRGIGFIAGAGYSTNNGSVMQPIGSPLELDTVEWQVISPMQFQQMVKFLNKYGAKRGHRTSYRQAVEEGWAPAPTNDYQRAIWNEIHSATNIADKAGNEDVAPPTNAPIR